MSSIDVHMMKFMEIDECPMIGQIISGQITVHGRKASEKNRSIKPGDHILFTVYRGSNNKGLVDVRVSEIRQYSDVEEFVRTEQLHNIVGDSTKCLNIKSEKDYTEYYSQFVDTDDILKLKKELGYGFLGFHIEFVHEYKVHRKSVRDPWFSYINSGEKNVEGMLNKGWVSELARYDRIIFMRNGKESDNFSTYVTELKYYKSFRDMLESLGNSRVLPGIGSIDKGVEIYRQYYSEDDETKYGVVGIHVKLLKK
jgi:ASC-1-like (ASCH) protein